MTLRSFLGLCLAALSLGACGATSTAPAAHATGESVNRDAHDLFHRGELAAAQGDTVRAEQYLGMALDRGFDEAKVLPIMLRVCLSSSRLRAALNHAEPYLRQHPNDQRLRYLVATIHLGLGQLDEARIHLNHLLRLDPNNTQAHYLLGVLESGARPDQAPEHFRKYLSLSPTGEHAVEIKSRLTDLAVRVDLNDNASLRAQAPQQRPSSVGESTTAVPMVRPPEAGWFETALEPTSTSLTNEETP